MDFQLPLGSLSFTMKMSLLKHKVLCTSQTSLKTDDIDSSYILDVHYVLSPGMA